MNLGESPFEKRCRFLLQPTGTEFRVMLVSKLSHFYKNTVTPVEDATAAGHKEKSRVNNFTKVE
jgi:hypothetical protein